MPHFSSASERHLVGVHPDLVRVCRAVVERYDICVLSGFRTESEQTALLEHDPPRTMLAWPHSKHNHMPALAVDLAPWPVDWTNVGEFHFMAGYVMAVAHDLGVPLLWGGRWRRFPDYGHFELEVE